MLITEQTSDEYTTNTNNYLLLLKLCEWEKQSTETEKVVISGTLEEVKTVTKKLNALQ